MQMMHCNMNRALASAALKTGLVGTSASPRIQHSFHLLFSMRILCTIHSLNGSLIPPAISRPTTDTPSEDRSSRRENSQCGFFLRWIFGKRADSLEHRCCEMQLPSHKAFSFSWSACSFQPCLIQRLRCSYLMMPVPSRAMSLRLPSLPCCSWYVLLVLPASSSCFWKLLSSSWYLGDQCSSGALSLQPVLALAQGRRGSTRQRSLRKIHRPLQTRHNVFCEQT